jgi:hypothetical protein
VAGRNGPFPVRSGRLKGGAGAGVAALRYRAVPASLGDMSRKCAGFWDQSYPAAPAEPGSARCTAGEEVSKFMTRKVFNCFGRLMVKLVLPVSKR